jgi:hypothetical protein
MSRGRPIQYTDEQILTRGREIAAATGGLPHAVWKAAADRPARSTVELRFGSWSAFCKLVGGRSSLRATDEELIAHGARLVAEHGALKHQHWDASHPPLSRSTVVSRFGSFAAFRLLCGAPSMEARILAHGLELARRGKSIPSYDAWDMTTPAPPCSTTAVYNHFGSWDALRSAVNEELAGEQQHVRTLAERIAG